MKRIDGKQFWSLVGIRIALLLPLLSFPLHGQGISQEAERAFRSIQEARSEVRLGRYQEALTKLNETVVFSEAANVPFAAAIAHSNIAEIYRIHGNTTEALNEFRKAISIYQQLGHGTGMAFIQRQIDSLMVPREPAEETQETPEEPTIPEQSKTTSLRKQLIDEAVERVRKRIQKEEKPETSLPPPSDYDSYLAGVRKAIIGAWSYPEQATLQQKEGKVDLEFTIFQDGRLASVRVVKSSGSDILDQGAMEAVRVASPFHPIPKQIGMNQITIEFTFNYVLEKRRSDGNQAKKQSIP